MMPLDNLLSRLEKVKKQGSGFVACCPAHQDKSPSMSITEADDGRVLIHCFAGCSTADVLAAIGLEMKDLFPDSGLSRDQKKTYFTTKKRRMYREILGLERTAMQIANNRLSRGEVLSPENQQRYQLAVSRVKKLEGLLNE